MRAAPAPCPAGPTGHVCFASFLCMVQAAHTHTHTHTHCTGRTTLTSYRPWPGWWMAQLYIMLWSRNSLYMSLPAS